MAKQERIRWPNGVSVSTPSLGVLPGIGGTYYFDPGSPSAPHVTLTQRRGMGGGGLRAVFLRNGMTSQDSLGGGATANAGLGVNATVNASIPDLRRPWNMKVSSIEGGIGLPGFAATNTYTPQQIADWMNKYLLPSAMGPQDELTPFARSLQSKNGSIGPSTAPAVPFLNPREQGALGAGMAGWSAGAKRPSVFDAGAAPVSYPSAPQGKMGRLPGLLASIAGTDAWDSTRPAPPAGGLLGLIREWMRNNPDGGAVP